MYKIRKYVSYGFPKVNFCNPGIHYETPCITPRWQYQTTLTILWNVVIIAVSLNTVTLWQHRSQSNFTLFIYFGIFTFTYRKKNSYLSASLHFATNIEQQPRHLSYPFWQTSVPCFINHLVINVSFSWSPLTPKAGKRRHSFIDDEISSHIHGQCTTVRSNYKTTTVAQNVMPPIFFSRKLFIQNVWNSRTV
jgi:hypothetical protein